MATAMRSHRMVRFKPNIINPLSQTPNLTVPDSGRRTPPKGILKNNDRKTEAVAELTVVASRNLVMGQVKILKRGEVLKQNEPLKDVTAVTSTVRNNLVADRETCKVMMSGRSFSPAKKQKKTEKIKMIDRSMRPDLKIVAKQTKKMSECFAGFIFSDSPPPSSLPLPGFLRRDL